MTNLTAMIIGTRDDIHVGTYSREGKYGFVIELGENHRPLVSSNATYASDLEAQESAEGLIETLRNNWGEAK